MGLIQVIRYVAGDYLWIEVARNVYLQDRWELLKNKDWEAGVNCV